MVGRTDPYTYYKGMGLRMTPEASLAFFKSEQERYARLVKKANVTVE